jgi:hypothetical protein
MYSAQVIVGVAAREFIERILKQVKISDRMLVPDIKAPPASWLELCASNSISARFRAYTYDVHARFLTVELSGARADV